MLIASASFALADNEVRYVYWMDNETVQHELTGNTIDCSKMMQGLHFIHFQAYDSQGIPVPSRTKKFLIYDATPSTVSKVTYWVDQDTTQYVLEGNTVECTDMNTGIHYIHFLAYDNNGTPVPSQTKSFLVLMQEEQASYRNTVYWFDSDTTKYELNGSTIDCSMLKTGLHSVHFQAYDTNNIASPSRSQSFIVLIENYTPTTAYSKIEYWYDNQTTRHEANGNTIRCDSLQMGMHTVHFQITDAEGKVTPAMTQTFLRIDDIFSGKKLLYWFDEEKERNTIDVTDSVISVKPLTYGDHAAHFLLANYQGGIVGTEVKAATFLVAPLKGDANNGTGVPLLASPLSLSLIHI